MSGSRLRPNKLPLRAAVALAALSVLCGCVSVPQGPTVAVMPGSGKSLAQFSADGSDCQQYAQASVAGPSKAAYDQSAANAVGGAAVGAAVGAMLGAVTGQAGAGAAWGAGTGLLFGSASAGNAGYASSYALQRQYDTAYMQCMYTHGNQVPARVVQHAGPGHYATQSRAPATQPAYAVPSNAVPAPAGTPPPAAVHYAVPPNALTPPPDTPPPQGLGPS